MKKEHFQPFYFSSIASELAICMGIKMSKWYFKMKKKGLFTGVVCVICLLVSGCQNGSSNHDDIQSQLNELQNQIDELENQASKKQSELEDAIDTITELENELSENDESSLESSKVEEHVDSSGTEKLSLSDAEDLFYEHHSKAKINVSKKEGNVYYIEGKEGTTIYKMKIDCDSSEIYLDKTINTRGH